MNRVILKSTVGNDGILHFDLALGSSEANTEVQITVESLPSKNWTPEEWRSQVHALAGSVVDATFEWLPQDYLQGREYEVREPLS